MMHPWAVRNRAGSDASALLLAVLLLTGVAGACEAVSEVDGSPSPALRGIGEPWQPVPFAVAPALIEAGVRACRANPGMIPGGTELVAADVRGGRALLLVFAGPGAEGECMLRVPPDGDPVVQSGGGGSGGQAGPLQPTELRIFTAAMSQPGGGAGVAGDHGYVTGQAGSAITAIQVEVSTGERLQATRSSSGWFTAWWPGTAEFRRAVGFDAAGAPIAEAR